MFLFTALADEPQALNGDCTAEGHHEIVAGADEDQPAVADDRNVDPPSVNADLNEAIPHDDLTSDSGFYHRAWAREGSKAQMRSYIWSEDGDAVTDTVSATSYRRHKFWTTCESSSGRAKGYTNWRILASGSLDYTYSLNSAASGSNSGIVSALIPGIAETIALEFETNDTGETTSGHEIQLSAETQAGLESDASIGVSADVAGKRFTGADLEGHTGRVINGGFGLRLRNNRRYDHSQGTSDTGRISISFEGSLRTLCPGKVETRNQDVHVSATQQMVTTGSSGERLGDITGKVRVFIDVQEESQCGDPLINDGPPTGGEDETPVPSPKGQHFIGSSPVTPGSGGTSYCVDLEGESENEHPGEKSLAHRLRYLTYCDRIEPNAGTTMSLVDSGEGPRYARFFADVRKGDSSGMPFSIRTSADSVIQVSGAVSIRPFSQSSGGISQPINITHTRTIPPGRWYVDVEVNPVGSGLANVELSFDSSFPEENTAYSSVEVVSHSVMPSSWSFGDASVEDDRYRELVSVEAIEYHSISLRVFGQGFDPHHYSVEVEHHSPTLSLTAAPKVALSVSSTPILAFSSEGHGEIVFRIVDSRPGVDDLLVPFRVIQ